MDSYKYKKKLYEKLEEDYCKSSTSDICNEIILKQDKLDELDQVYNLNQKDPRKVKRERK